MIATPNRPHAAPTRDPDARKQTVRVWRNGKTEQIIDWGITAVMEDEDYERHFDAPMECEMLQPGKRILVLHKQRSCYEYWVTIHEEPA